MNIYVWTDTLSKSIDLRGKTLAQVQAEWFDITSWNGSYTLDSNWLHTVSSSNDTAQLYYHLPSTLTSSNKLQLKQTWYTTRVETTYAGEWRMSFYNTYGDYISQWISWWYDTWSAWFWTWIMVASSLKEAWPKTTWWDFSMTLDIDFSTWKIDFVLTWAMSFTSTYTMNSTELNNALTYDYIQYNAMVYNSSWVSRIYTAEFTIL